MTDPRPVGLSIVIPVWNESAGIARTVQEARTALQRLVDLGALDDVEVVLVDDGSVDGTAAVLDALAADHDDLRVIHHDRNHGVGRAIRTGFAAARSDLVLYTDADLPVDLEEIGEIVGVLVTRDLALVAGYRRSRSVDGLRRWAYTLVWNAVVRVVTGLRVRDVNFAFKLVRADVLPTLELTSDGPLIDVELLARATRAGHTIEELAFDYQPRRWGTSSMASPAVGWGMLTELLARRAELSVRRRPSPAEGP